MTQSQANYVTNNKLKLIIFAIQMLLLIQYSNESASAALSYKKMGDDWPDMCQIGKLQSPIDIPLEKLSQIEEIGERFVGVNYWRNKNDFTNKQQVDDTVVVVAKSMRILNDQSQTLNIEQSEINESQSYLSSVFSSQSPINYKSNLESTNEQDSVIHHNSYLKMLLSDTQVKNIVVTDYHTTNQVNFQNGTGTLAFWNSTGELGLFKILQMHIHSPSEHTFDGKNYDLELHLVHRQFNSSSLAVVALYFDMEEGGDQHNEFIESLKLEEHNPQVPLIPLYDLLNEIQEDEGRAIFHYIGSLTTPPCSEGVNWVVVPKPMSQYKLQFNQCLFLRSNLKQSIIIGKRILNLPMEMEITEKLNHLTEGNFYTIQLIKEQLLKYSFMRLLLQVYYLYFDGYLFFKQFIYFSINILNNK